MLVWFYSRQGERAGGVYIYFGNPYFAPWYFLYDCTRNADFSYFPGNLPSEVVKIWRITLDKTAGIRLLIHINGVEVVNIVMADTCFQSHWREYWSRDVEKIQFFSTFDTASDYYRAVQTGICR